MKKADRNGSILISAFNQISNQYFTLQKNGDASELETFVRRQVEMVSGRQQFMMECVRSSEAMVQSETQILGGLIEQAYREYADCL